MSNGMKLTTRFNTDGPCHYCADRKPACHDNCQRYAEWKGRLKKVRKQLTHVRQECKTNTNIQAKAEYVEGKYIPVCDVMEILDCSRGKVHILRKKRDIPGSKSRKNQIPNL